MIIFVNLHSPYNCKSSCNQKYSPMTSMLKFNQHLDWLFWILNKLWFVIVGHFLITCIHSVVNLENQYSFFKHSKLIQFYMKRPSSKLDLTSSWPEGINRPVLNFYGHLWQMFPLRGKPSLERNTGIWDVFALAASRYHSALCQIKMP